MYKLMSSSRVSDASSIGFHRSIEAQEGELTNNETTIGNYHVTIYSKDVFRFAVQKKCFVSFKIQIKITRNSNNNVLIHPAKATDAANLALPGGVLIDDRRWYISLYTPNESNQKIMLGHIASGAATALSYIKRSYYMKDVTIENN